jgi:hypothetical protein
MRKAELDQITLEAVTKPLQKNTGLTVIVKRFFTDVNGTIVAKSLVPLSMQVDYPFWMFGQFDKSGGYKIGNVIAPPNINTPYLGSFVIGLDMPYLFGTGLNTIQRQTTIGDVVHVFTDNIDAPNYYAFIVQTSESASISSIYFNAIEAEKNKIHINGINMFVYSNGQPSLQFAKNVNLTRIDSLGAYVNHPETFLAFDQVDNKQAYFITVPLKMAVDQYNLVSSYIDFSADQIQFAFKILKNTLKV